MTAMTQFDACFSEAFSRGMCDIKFFVRENDETTAEALRDEALAFQAVINAGNITRIQAVD